MSRAFKCDICGRYCTEKQIYHAKDDFLDVSPEDARERGMPEEWIQIRDICEPCYEGMMTYIVSQYKKRSM